MTDYSKLNYQELVRIANNDSVANAMSEEEYEALSAELWKKFGAEKRIAAAPDGLLNPTKHQSGLKSFFSALRRGSSRRPTSDVRSESAGTRTSQQEPSFFRSGD